VTKRSPRLGGEKLRKKKTSAAKQNGFRLAALPRVGVDKNSRGRVAGRLGAHWGGVGREKF